MRHQARRRLLHLFKIKIMHTRLVENHMRHVRQAFFHIRHTPAAHNAALVCTLGIIGLPESGFINPAGLFQDALGKPEGFKHFHRAAGNTVGLSQLQWAGFLLHDHRADIWKRRQLRGQCEASRAAAHNQNIGLGRQVCRQGCRQGCALCWGRYGRVQKSGVACSKSVQMKLHGGPPCFAWPQLSPHQTIPSTHIFQ